MSVKDPFIVVKCIDEYQDPQISITINRPATNEIILYNFKKNAKGQYEITENKDGAEPKKVCWKDIKAAAKDIKNVFNDMQTSVHEKSFSPDGLDFVKLEERYPVAPDVVSEIPVALKEIVINFQPDPVKTIKQIDLPKIKPDKQEIKNKIVCTLNVSNGIIQGAELFNETSDNNLSRNGYRRTSVISKNESDLNELATYESYNKDKGHQDIPNSRSGCSLNVFTRHFKNVEEENPGCSVKYIINGREVKKNEFKDKLDKNIINLKAQMFGGGLKVSGVNHGQGFSSKGMGIESELEIS